MNLKLVTNRIKDNIIYKVILNDIKKLYFQWIIDINYFKTIILIHYENVNIFMYIIKSTKNNLRKILNLKLIYK